MLGAPPSDLSPLRQELRLSRGAPMLTGERAWVIHDPVRQRYFQIGRRAFELLSAWRNGTITRQDDGSDENIRGAYSDEEIKTMEEFLNQNNLLDRKEPGVARDLIQRNEKAKVSKFKRFMRNYLFFKVPLVRPNHFLHASLPYISPLFTRTFGYLVGVLGILALYLISRQWDEFTTTFMHFFSFKGAVLFGLTLAFVKTIHELAHGYMAARFGVRIPIMGVAFLLMFPMLYTDVSDAWRLRSRRQKVLIDSAGILAELTLAVLASLCWVFLPDGGARSVAFFIATTSWTLSVFINLNPLMRFDGYFIMADSLNITNLQTRSTNLGKWLLREVLFGLNLEAPEELPRRHTIGLALYAWAVWVYRFFLFLGIALIVYHATFKILGIFLFLAEIIWLIAIPIVTELKAWWQMRSKIMRNYRSLTLPLLLLVGVAFLALPLDRQVSIPAVLKADEEAHLFAPFPAQIASINIKAGQRVKKGDVLFTMQDSEKEFQLRQAQLRIESIDQRLSRISSSADDLANSQVLLSQKQREEQTVEGLRSEIDSLAIRSNIDGLVTTFDKDLKKGMWITESDKLATVISQTGASVKGLIAEIDLERVVTGASGTFIPDDPLKDPIEVNVTKIADVSDKFITQPYLASAFDGPIAVEPDAKQRLQPLAAHYGITFAAEQEPAPQQVLRGTVIVEAEAINYIGSIFANVMRVMIRESGV